MIRLQLTDHIRATYSAKVARTIEASAKVLVDLDARGRIVGVEVLAASKFGAPARRTLDRVARRYGAPELRKVHPKAFGRLYAPA